MSTDGMSEARLERLHDVMTGYVERGEVPGLVTLISRRGAIHVDTIGLLAQCRERDARAVRRGRGRAMEPSARLSLCRDFWTGAYQAIDD